MSSLSMYVHLPQLRSISVGPWSSRKAQACAELRLTVRLSNSCSQPRAQVQRVMALQQVSHGLSNSS